MLEKARACVCACPTTERNLGDGVVPADQLLDAGVRVALGTDSHTQIDLLEDARELEYHLRLKTLRRNVLAPAAVEDESVVAGTPEVAGLAARLFNCATVEGAESIGARAGSFEPGRTADFFTVDLADPTIAGASKDDLLPAIVFSLSRAAVRETAVCGRLFVEAGRHPAQEEIVSRFVSLQRKLWAH
jgi:formimidoylglutamate deiminase